MLAPLIEARSPNPSPLRFSASASQASVQCGARSYWLETRATSCPLTPAWCRGFPSCVEDLLRGEANVASWLDSLLTFESSNVHSLGSRRSSSGSAKPAWGRLLPKPLARPPSAPPGNHAVRIAGFQIPRFSPPRKNSPRTPDAPDAASESPRVSPCAPARATHWGRHVEVPIAPTWARGATSVSAERRSGVERWGFWPSPPRDYGPMVATP